LVPIPWDSLCQPRHAPEPSRTRPSLSESVGGENHDFECNVLWPASPTGWWPDAWQAIGAEYQNRRAGVLGTLGCFSFFPTKNLGGAGDGGLVTTDDATLAARIRRLRVHGEAGQYHHAEVGLNSRLDALQAAVLRVKLRYLDHWTSARQRNARRYETLFEEYGLLNCVWICRHTLAPPVGWPQMRLSEPPGRIVNSACAEGFGPRTWQVQPRVGKVLVAQASARGSWLHQG
jgi:hypothetical protein